MKNFNWENFKDNKIAINCDTEDKADDFLKQCHDKGFKWHSEDSLLDFNEWENYKNDTCYEYDYGNNIYCIPLNWYKENNYKIIEWEIDEIEKTTKYNIHGASEELFVELNESQVRLLNLLIDNGIIDEFDVAKSNNIEYKTV